MSGTAGHDPIGKTERCSLLANDRAETRIGRSGMTEDRVGKTETRLIELSNRISRLTAAINDAHEFFLIQIAQLQAKCHFAGDHVVCARFGLDPAHCAYLPSRYAGDYLVDFVDESTCREQGIMTLIHRGGAG